MLIEYLKNAPGAKAGDVKKIADHFAKVLILTGYAKRSTQDEPSVVNGDLLSENDADNEDLAVQQVPAKPKRTKKTTKTDTDTE
ncbi:hypothetical protein CPI31_05755 [Moraxella catarrhalis]|uniref:hypothetical protein n=1 Tax=Moraxella catarrhalis TaxID=480 RepID=UPI00071EF4E1|nr:hypothetical protein [Moraxella catarrhalis]AKI27418.1 hypothetical protein [Moraxella phage Mcat9]MPX19087.1 hypothetical protein [Moraxella catarrhalis]